MRHCLAILVCVWIGGQAAAAEMGVQVDRLTCEYAANPLGLDVAQPRFSWTLHSDQRGQVQTAYQILVADKWDSGKVDSNRSVHVVYQGQKLASGEKCWWKVRVWDLQGRPSPWSKPATFEMSLLEPGDWQGKWIGPAEGAPSPLLRKEFPIAKKIKSARAYISGLGWNELYINGSKVGDRVLDPATTYYDNDQPFELGSRVLYVTLDATEYLKKALRQNLWAN